VNLKRPSDDFLAKNGHQQDKVPRTKISKFVTSDEKIFCGYDDGLILAWIQKKEEISSKGVINEEDMKVISDLNKTEDYRNVYYLDLVLLGHRQQILDLHYFQAKNQLISTSIDYSIKYWDLTDGSTIYHFNIDTIAMKIIPFKDKKSEYFMFICKDNVKININTSVDPISINSNAFPYSSINNLLEHNGQLFLACYSPNIVVLNSQTLAKIAEFADSEVNEIYNLARFGTIISYHLEMIR